MLIYTFLFYTITGTCISSAEIDSARNWEDLRVCVKYRHNDSEPKVITDCHWGLTRPRSVLGAICH